MSRKILPIVWSEQLKFFKSILKGTIMLNQLKYLFMLVKKSKLIAAGYLIIFVFS